MSITDKYADHVWTDEYIAEMMELPRIWTTLDGGFEIQELKANRIDEIVNIIKVIQN